MAYRHRRSGFRRHPTAKPPVRSSPAVLPRKTKCRGCGQDIPAGELLTRLRLRKSRQVPCTTCSHRPPKVKYFHVHCVPVDIDAAMGILPAGPQAGPAPAYQAPRPVAAPSKPPTPEEAALVALLKFEEALITKAKACGVSKELEAHFKTYQNIKARALRPGTPAEGDTALRMALIHAVKLVF
jgi:hypothetical protein